LIAANAGCIGRSTSRERHETPPDGSEQRTPALK
jgi:hypothetical protein